MREPVPAVSRLLDSIKQAASSWLSLVLGLLAVGLVFILAAIFWPVPDGSLPLPPAGTASRGDARDFIPAQQGRPPRSPARAKDAFASLLAENPLLAARHVANLPEGDSEKDALLGELMGVWAANNPSEASGWLNDLPSGAFRDDATQELAAAWGGLGPNEAAQWAARELAGGRPMAASALLSVWGAAEPEAATLWLESLRGSDGLPEGAVAALSGALAYAWGQVDGAAAVDWASDHDDPAERSRAMVNATASWAQSDPQALATWLERNDGPDEPASLAVYVTLAAQWAGINPESAGRWALAIPEPELRDTTLASFASSLAVEDPARALEWSNSIQSAEKKRETLLDIYDTWLDDDLAAGRASLIARIPVVTDTGDRRELYALLHEKDPVFRAELYNLIEPDLSTDDGFEVEDQLQPESEPEVRKAIPLLENPVEVEELAK